MVFFIPLIIGAITIIFFIWALFDLQKFIKDYWWLSIIVGLLWIAYFLIR